MGVILNGILGGVSGKVGGVVGGNWKGINYLKAYTIPSNPQTAGQTAQRNKMSFAVYIARLILTTIVQAYWDPFSVRMSGYNKFLQTNLGLLSAADEFGELLVTEGNLEGASISSAIYTTATGLLSVSWDSTVMGNGLATDIPVVVIIDEEHGIAFSSAGVERADEEKVVTVGAGRTASMLHAYLFFYSGAGETLEVADSSYLITSVP